MLDLFVSAVVIPLCKPVVRFSRRWIHGKLSLRDSVNGTMRIYGQIGELRAATGADRVAVFKFQNGEVFVSQRPIWKLVCSHEVCGPGVASIESSPILASRVMPFLEPLFSGDGRPIVFDADEIKSDFIRSTLRTKGINSVVLCPLRDRRKLVFGFVGVYFLDFGHGEPAVEPDGVRMSLINDYTASIEAALGK